jgi:hypothetical protein
MGLNGWIVRDESRHVLKKSRREGGIAATFPPLC